MEYHQSLSVLLILLAQYISYCNASNCLYPGVPANSELTSSGRNGPTFVPGSVVRLTCYQGFQLVGSKMMFCQHTGNWFGTQPYCLPCPFGTYSASANPNVCVKCPDHTRTFTKGSRYKKLCICVDGYEGQNGGPCTAVRCRSLLPPYKGTMTNCGNYVYDTCPFHCDDGYIIGKGSSQRTCQKNGEWDGSSPVCKECPVDTYKSNDRSCLYCPRNSHTQNRKGNMKQGCVCKKGYEGPNGGPCKEINECLSNDGKGSCEDLCVNTDGSYKCDCSIPGYKLAADGHKCQVEKQCKNLTIGDAPDHGGLVCHWYRKENSIECRQICNKGYDFPDRINYYENCGPQTGYDWSFKRLDKDAKLPSCIEEFFSGFRSESDSFYFNGNCTKQDNNVISKFKSYLDEDKVCKRNPCQLCNTQDMEIICG